ncbi:MAG: HEAT repeat domain-containing protein [Myxococcaceae bacterium]
MSRPGLLSSLCVVAAITSGLTPAVAHAEDARVNFLIKQLAGAKDARVRAQTLLLLGQTGSDDAVPPLCGAMKDGESVVRSAAASALGELRTNASITCLKGLKETDPGVKAAIDKGIAAGAIESGTLYLSVDPVEDKVGDLPSNLVQLAEQTMRDKLNSYGASFAPVNEDKKQAASLIRNKKLKGFQLRMQLLPGSSEKGLKVEMLIMSYPEQALKGTWNVKAAGGKPESLIKAMVPRVVDDAANDLEWKK